MTRYINFSCCSNIYRQRREKNGAHKQNENKLPKADNMLFSICVWCVLVRSLIGSVPQQCWKLMMLEDRCGSYAIARPQVPRINFDIAIGIHLAGHTHIHHILSRCDSAGKELCMRPSIKRVHFHCRFNCENELGPSIRTCLRNWYCYMAACG